MGSDLYFNPPDSPENKLSALRKRNAQLSRENDILRDGLIKLRFYFEHMENEVVYDPEWMHTATSIGKRQIDSYILEANKVNPDPLESYYEVRPDNGY